MGLWDMRIFSTLLDCAYDLDILHQEEPSSALIISKNDFPTLATKQYIQILTNDGAVAICLTTFNGVRRSLYLEVQSTLRNVTNEQVISLFKEQLETFRFLYLNDDKSILLEAVLVSEIEHPASNIY